MRSILLGSVVLSLLLPSVTASWNAFGSREPSTDWDRTVGLMTQDAPADDGARHVYFNGFTSLCVPPYALSCTPVSANPNAAALGSTFETYPTLFAAMLGVWADCDGDGYVGNGASGLVEYRSELLALAPERCARGGDHDDGAWVHELLPIGASASEDAAARDVWHVEDASARVWADWGAPTDAAGFACYTVPMPRGTLAHSDGTLGWLDCFSAGRVGRSRHAIEDFTRVRVPDARNPWGQPQDDSIVRWDCDVAPIATTPDAGFGNLTIRPVALPQDPGHGTPAGTVNAMEAGTSKDCLRSSSDDYASLPYALEADVTDTMGVRTRVDHAFVYVPQGQTDPGSGVRAFPADGGARAADLAGLWRSLDVTAVSRNPYVDRDSLAVAAPTFVSYYAFVSPAAISTSHLVMPGGPRADVYGAHTCGSHVAGVWNGWDCARADWAPTTRGAIVGDAYRLLDVDCYDSSVDAARSLGVHYGVITGAPACG